MLLLLLFFFIIPLYSAAYTRYRPIGTDDTGKENRGSSASFYYRLQTNSSVALSIGSARQEKIYGYFDSSCANRNRDLESRLSWDKYARELFLRSIVSRLTQNEKEHGTRTAPPFFFLPRGKNGWIERNPVSWNKTEWFSFLKSIWSFSYCFLDYCTSRTLVQIKSNETTNYLNN